MRERMIINARGELGWRRRLLSDVLTACLWAGWILLWIPAFRKLHEVIRLHLNFEPAAREVLDTVDKELGAIARPARVHFVTLLPKTRSGKLLRRSLQALAEGRDPGDLTTIEDPAALQQVKDALAGTPA